MKSKRLIFVLMCFLMMSEMSAQNDGFFNETAASRDSNGAGFNFNIMPLSGNYGYLLDVLEMTDGLYFNDIEKGDGFSFNDLDLSSEDVCLGGGVLLLTGAALMYLQTRRNKKENND